MRLTIEPTTQVINEGTTDACRVWEGTADDGTPVVVFIRRVAVSKDAPAHVQERFARELEEQREPTVTWPTRLIL